MIITETQRLRIRWLVEDDADFINQLYNTEDFLRYIGDRGIRSADDARQFLREGPLAMYRDVGIGLYLVQLKRDHLNLGVCGLLKRETLDDIDIGYAFLPEFYGSGYAIESARAVLDYARSVLNLKRLVAITSGENVSSINVLKKLGMTFEKNMENEAGPTPTRLYGVQLD